MSNTIYIGILASVLAGLATGVGAIPILFTSNIKQKYQDTMLGFAAGVMLTASFFSLIIPALDIVEKDNSPSMAAIIVIIGILLGIAVVWLLHNLIPHEHEHLGREGLTQVKISKIWLFVITICIHNFPEGLAVGVAFGTGDVNTGMPVAFGIGLQNIPEGLAVAVALVSIGYSKYYALLVALISGLIEPIGGLLGVLTVSISSAVLPWGLAFAAGAMLFIIVHEIIPEIHSKRNNNIATVGLVSGMMIMLYLDVSLG